MGRRKEIVQRINTGNHYKNDKTTLDQLDLEILKILSKKSLNQHQLSKKISFSYPSLVKRVKKLEGLDYVVKKISKFNKHEKILNYSYHIPYKDIENSFNIKFK